MFLKYLEMSKHAELNHQKNYEGVIFGEATTFLRNECMCKFIVHKGVAAPHFLRNPHLDPACPFLKIFAFPPLFSVLPPFKIF